jgi:hypothetical protein
MSNILSEEEKEKIRRKQLRKIAELEKQKEISRLDDTEADINKRSVQHEAKERETKLAREEYEKKIFQDEMKRRGFMEYKGEWVSKADFVALKKQEKFNSTKREEKIEKARERKIDRAEEHYQTLRDTNLNQIKLMLRFARFSILLLLIGTVLPAIVGLEKVAAPAGILVLVGCVILFPCLMFLFEIEKSLMRAQRLIYDDELFDFEYENVKGWIRRLLRSLAIRIDPEIHQLFTYE